MSVTDDLELFVDEHRAPGRLVGDASALTPNGYRLSVSCACGVTFERWVTPQDADVDLLLADLRSGWN